MPLTKPEMMLIDVDGTLVDSVPDLAYCVDEMMRLLGRAPYGVDIVRTWVGNGVERLTRRALTGQLDGEPEDDEFAKAYPIFLDLYAKNTSRRSYLFDGVIEGLAYLESLDIKLGCVTNKAEQFTLPLLKDLGIYEQFAIIISGDTLPKSKPHPMPLLHGAQYFGVKPEDAMMLGDSISDIKASRAAGFQIVCMSYGYNHGEDIRKYNPDAVLDSMLELKTLF